MIFEPGQRIAGWRIDSVRPIPDIESEACIGVHEASGARLLYLANDDEDKSFAIGFRTPPESDTGVFHILEHSVLCGSERFPVKEPFVNLLQGSMQTFLNAMTFPDKTIYPVASTNDKDLMNLVDVYMDAVLRPAILTDPMIFAQEGWHIEAPERRAVYNGVVFNEMKGALSDPEEMLGVKVKETLFPDTCYRWESGGKPEAIPTLTYRKFLEDYHRHYRPDNSYIILYGNLDAEGMLAFLDEKHLTPWLAEHAGDDAGLAPREIAKQAPVFVEDADVEAVTTPDNEMASLSYVLPDGHDCRTLIATDILLSALAGTNESPLRRALLDADLADAVTMPITEEVLQPYVTVQLRGLHPGARERVKPTFEAILGDLIAKGFDRDMLSAAISRQEFTLRERDFGISNGVIYAMTALSTWLYDDDAAIDALEFSAHFAALREALGTGYFEDLAKRLFLENDHVAAVHLTPVEGEGPREEDRRLAEISAGWDDADYARVDAELAELRARQEREDTPEALATLPRLELSDLGEARERPGWHTEAAPGNDDTLLIHEVPTTGIGYFSVTFPVSHIDAEDLPYLAILARLLGRLDTEAHTALDIDTRALLHLGGYSFRAGILGSDTERDFALPTFMATASALIPESAFAAEFLAELVCTTRFDDLARIRTILAQWKIGLEDTFVNSGNTVARARVAASVRSAAAAADALSGIGFYRFLSALLDNWDSAGAEIPAKMRRMVAAVLADEGRTVSIAGGEEAEAAFVRAWYGAGETFAKAAAAADVSASSFACPELLPAGVAYTTPGSVTFTALGGDALSIGEALELPAEEIVSRASDGVWEVARNMLGFDFLWNTVRVKGGAYGVGFTKDVFRDMCFNSYRDPHVDETLERFADAADWLAGTDFAEEELETYIISTVSNFDAPVKPRMLVATQVQQHLMHRSPDLRLRRRAQALAATPADVRRIGEYLKAALPYMRTCTVGNADIIGKAASPAAIEPLM